MLNSSNKCDLSPSLSKYRDIYVFSVREGYYTLYSQSSYDVSLFNPRGFFHFSQITGGRPLAVEVVGVEYMNDDPAMTDVLYAKVRMKDGSDRWVPSSPPALSVCSPLFFCGSAAFWCLTPC